MNGRRVVIGIVVVFALIVGGAVAFRVVEQRKQAASLAGTEAEGVDLASTASVMKAARTYVGSQELGKAEAVLRRALAERPDDVIMREMLGDVLLQSGDKAGAMAQYADLAGGPDPTAEVLYKAGALRAELGENERADELLRRALVIEPGLLDAKIQLANAQLEQGKVAEAKATLTAAAVLDDGVGLVWGMLAEIALRENRIEIARQHIDKARTLEPGKIPWRVLAARIMRRQNDPERSVLLLDGLRGDDRFEPSVLEEMAAALGMLGRGDDALAIYLVAVREKPDSVEIRVRAAEWAEREGDAATALDLARTASMMGDERAKAIVKRLTDD